MKKNVFLLAASLAAVVSLKAQKDSTATKNVLPEEYSQKLFSQNNQISKRDNGAHHHRKESTKLFTIGDKPSDHLVFQLGYNGQSGTNDTTSVHGLSRQVNIAFMFNKPFQGSKHMSVGYGLGLNFDNFYYKSKYVDVKGGRNTLSYVTNYSSNMFKKFKLGLTYLEIPIELRYYKNIENPQQGLKFAVGIKPGYLLKAWTKGKNQMTGTSSSTYGTGYVRKESDKTYFNSYKLDATARVGYGAFSLYGSYSVFSMLKTNAGPNLQPFAIGVSISGL